jgi:hypothetical protein
MAGRYRIFDSIEQVDLPAWEHVRAAGGSSIFIDPGFMTAVESSMKQDYRFWYAIAEEDGGRPAACGALCAMTIDMADVTGQGVASVLRRLPEPLSRIRQLKGLFCGLPGSPGQNSLAVISADALAALDQAIGEVAMRAGADVIVYKEFGNEELPRMDRLVEFGYRRIPTQPMHFLKPAFPDFAHYCAALSSNYRASVNRSTRKLKPAGAEVKVFTDSDEILRVYTPEVHALYYQMVGKAEVNIELLPIEFFRQLTSRLKGHVELVTIIKEDRIIAIGWCLNVGSAFHLMYAGLDYQLNRELDLYFNLMYASLDRALRSGAAKIHVGQTASAFKARLGCHAESLYGYIKGRGLLMWPLVRFGADLVLSQMPTSPPADIFRKENGK